MAIKCTILRVDICPFEHKLISYRYATVPKQTPPSFNFLLIKAMIVECLKTALMSSISLRDTFCRTIVGYFGFIGFASADAKGGHF